MSTDIVPFEFGGEQLRVEMIDGEPWFVLADLCRFLDLTNVTRVAERIDPLTLSRTQVQNERGQMREAAIVSEAGMWEVMIRSDKPEAVALRRWITGEVLPQIRKTGSYSKPLTLAERSLALLSELSDEVQRQAAEIVELKPLASQARTFNKAKGNTGRQQFARAIVNWALDNGVTVKFDQVYEFMGGRKLDMFVHGVGRSDHGHASTAGLRRGYSATDRDESRINGHKYAQGVLTPAGYEYAWSRIENYVRKHGHLELPKKEISA